MSCDDSDSSWKIFAGRQLSRTLAVEFGYGDLGGASGDGTIGAQPASFNPKVTAWDLGLLFNVPLGERFGLLARLGLARSETEFTGTLLGAHLGVRAEWQRYQNTGGGSISDFLPADEDDIDVLSVGLSWKF